MLEEEKRLEENKSGPVPPWRKWGPYVSERSWGTVREDYGNTGDSWSFFTHEMARSKAYRWGEDGISGFCDRYQVLCLSFAFWNRHDPILKERLFGLTPHEGNHGEDVKEYYYHLDSTPSHSYMKYLYKYPHKEFPYDDLVNENKRRGMMDREYELIDTGIFDNNEYFDIFIEMAKNDPEDLCFKMEIHNRAEKEASLDVLPSLVFRNTWEYKENKEATPVISDGSTGSSSLLIADDANADPIPRLNIEYRLGKRYLYGEACETLFTNNDTNEELLYAGKNKTPYVKDAFHRSIIQKEDCLNPAKKGSKAALHYKNLSIPGKSSKTLYLRFTNKEMKDPLKDIEKIISLRKGEADLFYESIHPKNASEEDKKIQRLALAGMLWSKQIYLYDVNQWLKGDDPDNPPPDGRENIRNSHWKHLISKRILSMPDKWEYPWFAAWDLSFHTIALALVDMDFAKEQLWHLLFDQFQHPNGQIPAYEWEFSELNPPVQAWALWRLYNLEYEKKGIKDTNFLKKCYHKLILNFVWWVNKVDAKGNNVFEGGFLGLDNITIFDRSSEIPGGGSMEQSDGTGWMGMFCLLLMRMSLELAKKDYVYESLATKFFEHYIYIANALEHAQNREVQLWDEEDGFFYDVINLPDNKQERIKVRSLVGIIPLYAVDCITEEELSQFKEFSTNFHWFCNNRQDLIEHCITPLGEGKEKKYLLALMHIDQMKRVITRIWDPKEFRSDHGIRSLSKVYGEKSYELLDHSISYEPGEAEVVLKGGNSNWRGPIWFPTNFLLIESLKRFDEILGDEASITCNGQKLTPKEMAKTYSLGLLSLFQKGKNTYPPIYHDQKISEFDEHFTDHIFFYEHFHGDTGRGLGASHQTGWSGLIANIIDEYQKDN